jgi:psiF repeat-containing protein
MKYLTAAAIAVLLATAANAQAPMSTCKAQASDKKLAGAALKSFMTKCQKDAAASCNKDATDKKLAGAAKTSHVKKCTNDAVGS